MITTTSTQRSSEHSAWSQFSLSFSLSVSPDNSPATTHTRTCSPTSMERGTQEYLCSESAELFGKGMNYNKEANEGKKTSCVNGIRCRSKMDQRAIFRRACARRRWSYTVLAIFYTRTPTQMKMCSECRSEQESLLSCSLQWLVLWPSRSLSLSPCVWRVLNRWRRANAPYGIHCGRIEIRVTLSVSIWIWPEEDVEFYASRYSFSQVYKYHTFIIFTLSQCERKVFGKKKEIVKIFAHHQYFLFTLLVCGCFAIIFFFSICVFGKFTWNGFPQNILNSIEPNKIVCFTHFSWHISELWNKRN